MNSFSPVILKLKHVGLSDEQFYQLCQANETWQLEQTAKGRYYRTFLNTAFIVAA
jgi:hypothetical protein